jgi:hypothetical protein
MGFVYTVMTQNIYTLQKTTSILDEEAFGHDYPT